MIPPMINGNDVQQMIGAWLRTPVNGYLGSDRGSSLADFLHNPQSTFVADALVAKIRADIPLVGRMDQNQFGVYSVPVERDGLDIVIGVPGAFVSIDGIRTD